MKKLLYVFTAFCLLLTVFAPSVSVLASVSPSYTIEAVHIAPDKSFTVDIGISDNPGIISLRMAVTYEDSVELISAADKKLLNGWTAPSSTLTSPYTLRWADSLATVNNTANGGIVTLTFKIKDAQTEPETLMLSIEHIEARNASGEKVYFAETASIINLTPALDDVIIPLDGSGLDVDEDNALLSGVTPGTTVNGLLADLTGGNIEIYKNGEPLGGNDLVGTGCVIRLMDGENVLDSLTVVIKGDVDGDGKVNISDARKVLRVAVNLENFDGNPAAAYAADIDGSGKSEISDARKILRVAVGLQSF